MPAPLKIESKFDLATTASLSLDKLASNLNTSLAGLNSHQLHTNKSKYGPNTLNLEPVTSPWLEYLKNFKNPLVLILALVATISFFMGELFDGGLVIVMIFLSVTLNFIQEHKAGEAAKKLKNSVAVIACVRRANKTQTVNVADLYPGDLLELNAGDIIPADARIIEAKDFFVNQASLTGESLPQEKHPQPPSLVHPSLTDLTNIILSGTNVITGTATALIINTGTNTEFGQITNSIIKEETPNEFARGINQFSNFILRIIVIFVVVIFTINLLIKGNFLESLAFSVAVAVGLTPEFLPMIMSVTMGIGSVRMAKKGVIVKKLSAIPTFGSIDILCTDKTGTLTQDRIKVVKHVDLKGNPSEQVLNLAYLNSYFQTGITNPLDQAIIDYQTFDHKDYKKIDEIPFDFNRKRLSIVVKHHQNYLLISKGAPEEIISECKFAQFGHQIVSLSPRIKKDFITQYQQMSQEGFRVLALATKNVALKHPYTKADEVDATIIGFMAFLDPAKKGANAAIKELANLGVEIKVVTGDNELLAQKICNDVGINVKGVMLGHQLADLNPKTRSAQIANTTIFARFSPDQKNNVIKTLQEAGHVVGYMGDGINDAPSLKTADVGISVANAVAVAKESADFILTRKSLHVLTDGVIEGRNTFGNTIKYILMGTSSSFGNMFSVLGAVLFLPYLPMLPVQILLNNFLYDLSQLTLPLDKVDATFSQKPRRWNMKFIRNFMIVFGPISSLFDFVSFFVLYSFFKTDAGSFQTGWFMQSIATQTLVIHLIRTKSLPFINTRAHPLLIFSTFAVVTIGWIIPFTPLAKFFGLNPLDLNLVGLLMLIVIGYLIILEIGKQIFYKLQPQF